MACKSIERFKQGVTDDRQTDHATEKWVAIGEIACARAISPNNTDRKRKHKYCDV